MLVVAAALLVAMFSLQRTPNALDPSIPPDAFDGEAAATLAAEIASASPSPEPGSDADAAIGAEVSERFQQISSAIVSEQRFETEVDGEDVELNNLIAVLPGRTERQIALIAHRDTDLGSGAASGSAATAALIEIASGFSGSTHEKTLVFVSTDGGSAGALGARRFLRDYTGIGELDAAVVLSQPAAPEPEPPLVIPWSSGPQSTSSVLALTANEILSEQVDVPAGDEGPVSDLFRLAIPAALGEQGPLIEGGVDAVRISSNGELPLRGGADEPDQVDVETMDRVGRAALSLMLALDEAETPLEHGPGTYIGLAGNLMPGWALALLALALLAPPALASSAAVARAAHSPAHAAKALGWAGVRAVPFALFLAAILLFELLGLVPGPEFPFFPEAEDLGLRGRIGVGLALVVGGVSAFFLRPLLAPPEELASLAGAAALLLGVAAAAAVWLVNPYLCLILAVGLQAWAPAAGGVAPGRLAAAGLVLAAALPLAAALADLAGRFDAGLGVLVDVLLLYTGGELPFVVGPLACVLGGAALAIVAANGGVAPADAPRVGLRAWIERGRRLEEGGGRTGRHVGEPGEPDPAPADVEPREIPEPEPEPEPQPERDPRLWSKPAGSSALPSGARMTAPSPSAS